MTSSDNSNVDPPIQLSALFFIATFGAILTYLIINLTVGNSPPGHDFWWSKEIARAFLSGEDPYAQEFNRFQVPYPLPIFVIGMLFLPFNAQLSAALFNGITLFFLLWGMQKSGELWRWPLFLSLPFISAFILPQWAVLLLAAWFFPIIAPYLVLIKPQNALPIGLAKWSWKGIFIAASILLFTLVVYPTWPWVWLNLTENYIYLIPFLVLPFGPLLLLSVINWKTSAGRLLFFMSLLPFRAYYDLPLLWLIPENRTQIWILTVVSWIPALLPLFNFEIEFVQPRWSIAILFFPALCMLLWNHNRDQLKWLEKWKPS
ncbi:MAG: hypothetical protein AAF633_17715 [Chloroflexota bacterium]